MDENVEPVNEFDRPVDPEREIELLKFVSFLNERTDFFDFDFVGEICADVPIGEKIDLRLDLQTARFHIRRYLSGRDLNFVGFGDLPLDDPQIQPRHPVPPAIDLG